MAENWSSTIKATQQAWFDRVVKIKFPSNRLANQNEDFGSLAQMANIIIINVHYRLGVFALFDSAAKFDCETDESCTSNSRNLGLLDQRNALYIISDNFESIGIDETKVILGGHDHGAQVKV